MRTDEEIKFRVSRADKALLAAAAELEQVSLTDFLRGPAVARAKALVEAATLRQATLIPVDEYGTFMVALDAPVDSAPFERAAARLAELPLD